MQNPLTDLGKAVSLLLRPADAPTHTVAAARSGAGTRPYALADGSYYRSSLSPARWAQSTAVRLHRSRDHAVSTSLSLLGRLHSLLGDHPRAEQACQRAVAMREQVLGPHHPDVACSINALADILLAQHHEQQAEEASFKALSILGEACTPQHPALAHCVTNLSQLYGSDGAPASARPPHWHPLSLLPRRRASHHTVVANDLEELAESYIDRGALAQAGILLNHAVNLR